MNNVRKTAKVQTLARKRNIVPLMSIQDVIHTRGKIVDDKPDMIKIKLNRKLIDDLKDIYDASERDESEYIGAVRVTHSGKGLVKFSTPTQHTNRQKLYVIPPANIRNDMIVYHSHPIPKDSGLPRSLVTLPSTPDIRYYLESYPTLQANIILERHGYYLIDVIETKMNNKPNPEVVRQTFYQLLQHKGMDQYMVPYMVGNVDIALINVSIKSWQDVMNTYIDKVMSHRFGVSIRYYRYSELPEITLVNPLAVPVPMSVN